MSLQVPFDFSDAPGAGAGEAVGDASTAAPPLRYEVRVSRRAKRLTLRVLPGRGLVVTVPHRYPRREVPAAVEAHRAWAVEALARADEGIPDICLEWPPRRLELAAIGVRVWLAGEPVVSDDAGNAASSLDGERVLGLSAPLTERAAVAQEIATWLKALARTRLPARLAQLAGRHGLAYTRCSVRGQRSVWGSYSSSGTLSLNYKLLFLRPALVDYVLLHELAHTQHLDHSPRFWALLESVCPDARSLDATLRTAGRHVPPWLELAR